MIERDALQAVADVLNDIELTPEERNEFRSIVKGIAAHWRGTPTSDLNPRLSV